MDSRKCRRWCKRILTRSSNASNKEWIKRTSQRAEWETNEWWKCERETLPVRVVCRKKIDLWNNNVSGLVRGFFPSRCKCWKRNGYFIASVVIGFNRINSMKFNSLIFEKEGTNCCLESWRRLQKEEFWFWEIIESFRKFRWLEGSSGNDSRTFPRGSKDFYLRYRYYNIEDYTIFRQLVVRFSSRFAE